MKPLASNAEACFASAFKGLEGEICDTLRAFLAFEIVAENTVFDPDMTKRAAGELNRPLRPGEVVFIFTSDEFNALNYAAGHCGDKLRDLERRYFADFEAAREGQER